MMIAWAEVGAGAGEGGYEQSWRSSHVLQTDDGPPHTT